MGLESVQVIRAKRSHGCDTTVTPSSLVPALHTGEASGRHTQSACCGGLGAVARPCVPHMPSGPHMAGPNAGATSASELWGSVVCGGRSGLSARLPQGRECSARSCRQGLHVIQRERADSGLGPVDTAENLQCGASTSQRGEEEKAFPSLPLDLLSVHTALAGSRGTVAHASPHWPSRAPAATLRRYWGAVAFGRGTPQPSLGAGCTYCSIRVLPRLGVTVPHCHAGE